MRWEIVAAALAVVALAGAEASAQGACRPPAQNTRTLLDTLPADAGYPVLAQVELMDLVDATPRGQPSSEAVASRVRVRVVLPIKGVARGDVFVVDTGGATCDQVLRLDDLREKAFIAGRFFTDRNDRTFFVGPHKLP
jgi:hypothetical protein